ncbi:MAG: hypothetical protein ACK41C_11070 [Phenylobacterium sp.]|uniref:hypothetical protein n=1 Tax=Phenylobacterium sp. TaxID=1871053 RepID=UPI00391CF14A
MSILVAVIVAGVCGGLGALAGGILTRSAGARLQGLVITVCAVAGAAGGRHIAEVFIEPHIAVMTVERQLSEHPTFSVLKENYPVEYAQAIRQLRGAIRDGQNQIDASNAVRAHIGLAVGSALPKADRANTLNIMRVTHEEGIALRRVSEVECGRFLSTGTTNLHLPDVFGPELMARDVQVTAALLKQAATTPQSWPTTSPNEVESVWAAAMRRPSSEDRARLDAWAANGAPSSDLEATCIFTLALLEELLEMPEDEGAAAYHALLAEQSPG